MADQTAPYLCGGVFFTLLVEASRERVSPTKGYKGIKGDVRDEYIMKDLVELPGKGFANFDKQSDFGDSVSKYKNCRSDYGMSMPFRKYEYKESLREKITQDTDRALYLMSIILKKYFAMKKRGDGIYPLDLAVRKILYVIKKDDDIGRDDELLCGKNCTPIKKKDLVQAKAIDIQPFLLGVWNYILQNRPDNKHGQDTLKLIYLDKENPNDTGDYNPSFANGFRTDLIVNRPSFPGVEAKLSEAYGDDIHDPAAYDIPVVEGDVIEPNSESGRDSFQEDGDCTKSGSTINYINNGVIVGSVLGDLHL
ncbi:MAG: hypothetical protein J5943_03365 [Oribacterium sp.]|uniref:hypothetical protein n=1 Tax=Butyrivibrio sp. TaxID=28121 RepID=UPI001B0E2B09|nr:hypothetical protein [Butyrivibrio sp.]MBO5597628.1 hypothetical protein [Oribacterium sp.]MBO6242836.1 hypothetical protein [Butyrivibrio sp.]MBO6307758.1 hypothetical protein [Oribacterium sp.]MBP3803852.1 hypothetical protein [Oribacterium sp.]